MSTRRDDLGSDWDYRPPDGAAAVVDRPGRERTFEMEMPDAYPTWQDRVRWGPLWAGLVTTLTTATLLGLLGLAIGFTAATSGGNQPANAGGTFSAIWGAITGIIAFLFGGFVTARTAAVYDRRWGAWNGGLLFALTVPLVFLLAGSTITGLAGVLGNFAGALNIDLSQLNSLANQAQQNAPNVQNADQIRNGAWITLVSLLVALGSSIIGGIVGTKTTADLGRVPGEIRAR